MNGSKAHPSGRQNDNPIDNVLEYVDPTPNVHDLFVSFNERFFWGKLGMVEVKWSNRMTSCAGLCTYQGKSGLCTIKLSAPLLILRPRKDLVETLLHEMIHAYLFMTKNFKDREDHGPEFKKHMHRINQEAGTNINIFHRFHDEVAFYQRHVWRCKGPCRNQQPYFGFVKRAMNRPPGPSDYWWMAHSVKCGGDFEKIETPQNEAKKKNENGKGKRRKIATGTRDIQDYFRGFGPELPSTSKGDKTEDSSASSSSATVEEDKSKCSKSNKQNKESTGSSEEIKVKPGTSQSEGKNYGNVDDEQKKIMETVRNFWTQKYPLQTEGSTGIKRDSSNIPPTDDTVANPKKALIQCPMCAKPFEEDIINDHVNVCMEEENSVEFLYETPPLEVVEDSDDEHLHCPICGEDLDKDELNEHLEACFSFTFENEETAADDEADAGKVLCPCCSKWVREININQHIDECLTLMTLKSNPESA